MLVPEDALAKLAAFRAEAKFRGDQDGMYTGVFDETERLQAESILNALIDRVAKGLEKQPTSDFVLTEFKAALDKFQLFDTEDREQVCAYLETIMDCVGLESSDGLLNDWLYGFDPTAL
jgi:hypothetical protein